VLAWTPVSVAEIFAGVRKGEESQLENLFLVLETVPLSGEIGRKAGYYLNTYSKSHGVELGDALIAATAYFNKMPLWTLNRRHHPMRDVRFFSPRGQA
jgi:predicted nucleic acid-binding protein